MFEENHKYYEIPELGCRKCGTKTQEIFDIYWHLKITFDNIKPPNWQHNRNEGFLYLERHLYSNSIILKIYSISFAFLFLTFFNASYFHLKYVYSF